MDITNRTEQVARAVAEALGVTFAPHKMDGVLDFWTEWPEYKNAERDAFQASSWSGPDKFLSDMNTARRFWEWVASQTVGPTIEDVLARGDALRQFPLHAFKNCPSAIEALAVACGLIEPESK